MARIIGTRFNDGPFFSLEPARFVNGTNAADLIVGQGGSDILYGNGGADTIYGDEADPASWILPDGEAGRDFLDGGAGDDRLYGGAGDDTLSGGLGNDVMTGGTGNDTYYVDSSGHEFLFDEVIERAGVGSGIDTVNSSVTYWLSENVENLNLIGVGAINGYGNDQHNIIKGNSADNVLNGRGGADRYVGGAGNDSLDFDPADLTPSGVRYDGGPGDDEIFLVWQTLDLTTTPNDRITGVEELDLTGGDNRLRFNAFDVRDLVTNLPDSNDLWVTGNTGDSTTLVGPWSKLPDVYTIRDGIGDWYEHYVSLVIPSVDAFVDSNITQAVVSF